MFSLSNKRDKLFAISLLVVENPRVYVFPSLFVSGKPSPSKYPERKLKMRLLLSVKIKFGMLLILAFLPFLKPRFCKNLDKKMDSQERIGVPLELTFLKGFLPDSFFIRFE